MHTIIDCGGSGYFFSLFPIIVNTGIVNIKDAIIFQLKAADTVSLYLYRNNQINYIACAKLYTTVGKIRDSIPYNSLIINQYSNCIT